MRSALKDPKHKICLAEYRAFSSAQIGIKLATVGRD